MAKSADKKNHYAEILSQEPRRYRDHLLPETYDREVKAKKELAEKKEGAVRKFSECLSKLNDSISANNEDSSTRCFNMVEMALHGSSLSNINKAHDSSEEEGEKMPKDKGNTRVPRSQRHRVAKNESPKEDSFSSALKRASTSVSNATKTSAHPVRRTRTAEHKASRGRGRGHHGSDVAKAQLTCSLNRAPVNIIDELLLENDDIEEEEAPHKPRPNLESRESGRRRVKEDRPNALGRSEAKRYVQEDLLVEDDQVATEIASHKVRGLGSIKTEHSGLGPDRRSKVF